MDRKSFMSSRSSLFLAAVLAAVAALLAACGTPEATPTPRPQATPTPGAPGETPAPGDGAFQQEWDALIAAAQQEGAMVALGGGAASRTLGPVLRHFSQLFGLDATLAAGGGSEHADRLLAERRAGRYTADLVIVGASTLNERMVANDIIDPIEPYLIHPDVLDVNNWFGGRHWFRDPQQRYVFMYAATADPLPIAMRYNTNLVTEEDIANFNSVWDFLDDRWKGQIVALPPDAAGAGGTWFITHVHPEIGDEWTRRFIQEMDVTFVSEARVIADGLARGGYAMAIAVGAAGRDVDSLSDEGLPVARFFGPVQEAGILSGGGMTQLAVVNQPAHPDAVKLFVNWFLSQEGQTALHEISGDTPDPSLRVDVPPGMTLEEERRVPDMDYLFPDGDPEMLERYGRALEIAAEFYRASR